MKLKHFLAAVLILLIGALLISGCPKKAPKKPTPLTKAVKPKKGGEIVVCIEEEPPILNLFLEDGQMQSTKDIVGNILWGLLVVKPDFTYAPRLAEKVPTKENGLVTENPFTVTFKIKKEAKWSDGKPITSADVVFTWQTIMDERWKIASTVGYDKIKRIETPDDKTVKIVFKEPYAAYKELFSVSAVVLPKHILKGKDFNEALNKSIPVASGPFKFKEWDAGDHVTLERNENFWGRKAYLDKITFKFIPDTNTELSLFKTGELDAINPSPDVSLLEQLRAIEGKEVQADPGTMWEHLTFNTKKGALADVRVRQAIAYAIDREAITEQVMKGQVRPLNSVLVPRQKPFYTPAWAKYKRDITKARELLEKAGYVKGANGFYEKDGQPLKLTISTTAGDAAREKIEQVIQENLREVGIKLEIKNADAGTFFTSWVMEGNYEIGEWAWIASPDPSITTIFAADQIPPDGQNFALYVNNKVSEFLQESDKEASVKERARLLRKAQKLIAEDVPILPLYQRLQILAYDGKIEGAQNNATMEGAFWNIGSWWLK
jgi:peptide/nickel transport system substrate-binding protein